MGIRVFENVDGGEVPGTMCRSSLAVKEQKSLQSLQIGREEEAWWDRPRAVMLTFMLFEINVFIASDKISFPWNLRWAFVPSDPPSMT